MKRYFVYSFYYSSSYGGKSGIGYVITDDSFPSKRSILNKHGIPSNVLNMCSISEVKSTKDISEFLEKEVNDEVNYPFTT